MCTLHHMKPSKVIHIGSLTNLIVKQHRRGGQAGWKQSFTIIVLLIIFDIKKGYRKGLYRDLQTLFQNKL